MRGRQVELAVDVDGEPVARAHDLQHRLDALDVVGERHAAHLHLHAGVAEVEIVLHLVLQPVEVLAGVVVAAGRVDPRLVVEFPAVVAVGQKLPQRHALGLGHGIPQRHVEHAHRHRALAVAARLLVGHHGGPALGGIEQAFAVEQRVGLGLLEARDEPFAQKSLLGIAAVGVEAVADHRLALDLEVGLDRHDARRHLAEVDIGVGDVGADRRDDVADGDDAHGDLLQATAARRVWRISSHQASRAVMTFQAIPLRKAAR